MKKDATFMAIDQYGTTFHGLENPRKDLAVRLGRSAGGARKMYVDLKDGSVEHVGYVIGGHWLRVYEVSRWKEKKK